MTGANLNVFSEESLYNATMLRDSLKKIIRATDIRWCVCDDDGAEVELETSKHHPKATLKRNKRAHLT